MESAHEPGCDQQHAPRQACNQALQQQSAPPPADPTAPALHPTPSDAASYCVQCGRTSSAAARYCKHCGSPLTSSRARRVSGIAFLLNEAHSDALGALVSDADRSRLIAHYEEELRSLVPPVPGVPVPARPAPQPRPAMPQVPHPAPAPPTAAMPAAVAMPAPVQAAHVAPVPAATARVSGPRFRPPAPPRPPRDWSWLADQQANLFLFAGAFLVVIAALIFVAYSGETVSGTLKMSLLAGFTIAFLAAGTVCQRIPRVLAAGHVFFAVGAILVPLNFVAAYTILTDRNLDPQALWLAGSLTSALLYTSVATLGMGRPYAFSSGTALMSAAAAAAAVADLPVEWTPAVFLALAVLMSAVALRGPQVMRQQIGRMWTAQAHVVAVAATLAAIVMALIAAPDSATFEVASRWFLPVAFAVALAYACIFAASQHDDTAGQAAVIALSGAFVTVIYALSLPAEMYTLAFAALALLLGILLPAMEREPVKDRLPGALPQFADAAAIAASIVAVGIALIFASASRGEDVSRHFVPESHWFAAPSLALLLVFYLLDAFGRRQRIGVTGSVLALAGLGAAFVYGLDASAEYYALALTGTGVALVLFLRWVLARIPAHLVHPDTDGDVRVLAQVALAGGTAVAICAALAAGAEDATYAPQTPWFLFAAFAGAFAAYGIYLTLPMPVTRSHDRLAPYGLTLAVVGMATSIVFGLDASAEYYAIAFTGSGIVLVAALRVALPRIRNGVLLAYVEPGIRILTQATVATGIGVAVLAALVASSPEYAYTPQSPWFLFATFASAMVAYALYLTLPMPVARWHDAVAPSALALAVAGMATSVVYGLDASAEYYGIAFTGSAILLAAALHGAVRTLRISVLLTYIDPAIGLLAQAMLVAGISVAISAALAASDATATYAPQTPWFLFATFASAAAGYALCAMLKGPVQWYSHLAHLGPGLMLVGTATSVVYGLDASPEYYGFAFVAGAVTVLMVAWTLLPRVQPEATVSVVLDNYLAVSHAAAFTAGCIAVGAVLSSATEGATYHPESRWFLPILFAALAGFYALAVGSRLRPVPGSEPIAPLGFAASVFGVTTGIVYALHASPEHYAFAFVLPAMAIGLVARVDEPRFVTRLLPAGWRDPAIVVGRIAISAGLVIAIIAAVAASDPGSSYRPDARAFLPLVFLAASVFFVFDASRGRDWRRSAALLAALGGTGVTVVYAADLGVEYYGVAFACVGILFGFGGRAWSPDWLDPRSRDAIAVIAVTTAWLPLEGRYADHPRVGALAHLAAAVFYAMAAFTDRSERTVGQLMDFGRDVPVRLATGWLYAAGWVATIGYILLLRGTSAGEEAGTGSLAMPLLALTLAFLLVGATARFWRREFGIHLYVMGLLLSIAALSAAPEAGVLATVLSVLVGAFIAVAVWEDAPIAGVPAAIFGFMAVAAWQQRLDAPQYVIPLAYSTIAVCAYLAGFALRRVAPRWSTAVRACAAAYALVAPAAGFGILGARTDHRLYRGAPYEQSALYQWSTVATALIGLLATIESSIARRGWVVIVGTAVLAVALLLEIGHFRPDSVQPYTATVGIYLVLLGLLGLWKFKLVPELEDTAPAVEALGAVIVMFPSFMQSLSGGWFYQVLVLTEAAIFFSVSVALRRRVLLSVSLMALVIIAGRALFDAINALPNWIVILIAGLALLGIGTAILIARDRWERWEQTIMSWWNEPGHPEKAG